MFVTVTLAALAALAALASADPNDNPSHPLLAKFAFVEPDLFPSGALQLYWKIESQGDPMNESIHVALAFNATKYWLAENPFSPPRSVWNSWIGVGWGSSMLSSESIIAWANPGTKMLVVGEYRPSGSYSPAVSISDGVIRFGPNNNLTSTVVDNTMIFEFVRPTHPSSPSVAVNPVQIDVNMPTNHIYAFNPNPNPAAQSGWKDWHGAENRGAYLITYATGVAASTQPDSIYAKRVHGSVMAGVWIIIFPVSIYYTRYFKSTPGWVRVHAVAQAIGSAVGVLGGAIYIILNLGANNFRTNWNTAVIFRPHSILGLTIVTGTLIQTVFGIFNRMTLSSETNVDRSRPSFVRTVHTWIGRILILAAFVQAGLGIEILYPLSEVKFRGIEAWIVYIVFIAFWVAIFIVSDAYYQMRLIKSRDTGESEGHAQNRFIRWRSSPEQEQAVEISEARSPNRMFGKGAKRFSVIVGLPSSTHLREDLATYTWEDIDACIRRGKHLVVANGKYVFDLDPWISSHPGGQMILYSVAGTDITNDFFHEAGFDAAEFVPKRSVTIKSNHRKLPSLVQSPMSSSMTLDPYLQNEYHPRPPSNLRWSTFEQMALMDEREWKFVIRARHTHVHTKPAIARLSSLLVGGLILSQNQNRESNQAMLEESTDRLFVAFEYRRYALVSTQMVTPKGTTTPVYRLKFCILYPFDTRVGEPDRFQPGQCMEIQSRINGKYVSRFYTPINGCPSSFEVLVKVYPTGIMTPILAKQKPGDRQFKIRGPFGVPIISPDRPLSMYSPDWCYERLIFVACGSGIVPALQILQTVFLPTFVPLYVWQPYNPAHPDEIALQAGDWVIARHHLYDGWAEGVNLRTGQEGLFPLPLTISRVGGHVKISIVNAVRSKKDMIGLDIFNGVSLAYPNQVSFVHCFSHDVDQTASPMLEIPGACTNGRIDIHALAAALDAVGWIPPQEQDVVDHRPISHISFASQQHGPAAALAAQQLQHEQDHRQLVVVCGTKSFEGAVYDILTSDLGLLHESIRILPDESC